MWEGAACVLPQLFLSPVQNTGFTRYFFLTPYINVRSRSDISDRLPGSAPWILPQTIPRCHI